MRGVIEYPDMSAHLHRMKNARFPLIAALLLGFASSASAADCYADYKAKRDNPLRLHYGVAQIAGTCSQDQARTEIAARLDRNGWTLLNVLSLFDASGLEERKRSAGQYYLRF